MNIPKIEEAITLLYQTYIEDQDVATQRGIAITAMNEMVNLLGGEDIVKKIEAVPYSARLRTQHLFEDEPQPKQEPAAMRYDFDGYGYKYIDSGSGSDWQTRIKDAEPVYSKPQQRTWVGLTLEDQKLLADSASSNNWNDFQMMDLIEAKLKEKNT